MIDRQAYKKTYMYAVRKLSKAIRNFCSAVVVLIASKIPICKYCGGFGRRGLFLGERCYECRDCEHMWKA